MSRLFSLCVLCLFNSMLLAVDAADPDGPPITDFAAGHVQAWAVLGPFPSEEVEDGSPRSGFTTDLLAEAGGEAGARLVVGTEVLGRSVRLIESWESGYAEDRRFDRQVGYAACQIRSPGARRVRLYLASNGSPRLWVNGHEVIAEFAPRHKHSRWQHAAWMDLRPGLNRVVAKIDNRRGWWGLQAEWYDEEAHEASLPAVVKGWDFVASSVAGATATFTVDTKPSLLDRAVPVSAELHFDEHEPIVVTGLAGQPLVFELPEGVGDTGALRLTCGEQVLGLKPWRREVLLADLASVQVDLLTAFDGLQAELLADRTWGPIYRDVLAWQRYWAGGELVATDRRVISTLAQAKALVAALAAGANPIADNPGMSFPARCSVGELTWNYNVTMTGSLDGGALPAMISLHGSGGTDRPIGFGGNMGDQHDDSGLPPHIRLAPRAMSGTWWRAEFLDALLDHWLSTYPIDENQVSLTGFSMGGMGTWAWAAAFPQRFSAISPQAGYGDPRLAVRWRHIPVWAVQGERDRAIWPYQMERTVTAAQAAGCTVRYTLLSEAAHGFRGKFDGNQVIRWLLAQRRSTESVIEVALPELDEQGLGELDVSQRQVAQILTRAISTDTLGLRQEFREAVIDLARVWRLCGRAYHVPTRLLIDDVAALGEVLEVSVAVEEIYRVPLEDGPVARRTLAAGRVARLPFACSDADLAALVEAARARVVAAGQRPTGAVQLIIDWYGRYDRHWYGTMELAIE